MKRYKFKQVDVFTRVPYMGNPVAVVLDAEGMDAVAMQRLAAWTNLSETTFVMPPGGAEADYHLRIFTPGRELPFAGHPTVGSAHAILEAGLISTESGRLIQECGAGLIELEVIGNGTDRQILVTSPPPRITSCPESLRGELEQALDLTMAAHNIPLIVDVGPRWLVIECTGKQAVQELRPDLSRVSELSQAHKLTGITAFGLTGQKEIPVYVRSFAPVEGIPEDPVCGSGNISVGAYLQHKGLLERTGHSYTANQGLELGRDGYVFVQTEPDSGIIRIGGHAVTCIDGYLRC